MIIFGWNDFNLSSSNYSCSPHESEMNIVEELTILNYGVDLLYDGAG